MPPSRRIPIFMALATLIFICYHLRFSRFPSSEDSLQDLDFGDPPEHLKPSTLELPPDEKRLVVASLKADDTRWIQKRLPDWPVSRYLADDPEANLTVPMNKGREAMVYLTYIIDNYSNLPLTTVFIHSLQFQWHNDDSNKDGATVLSRLQIPYVQQEGYVSLRCAWSLGCPSEIHTNQKKYDFPETTTFRTAFSEIFPKRAALNDIPDVIGAGCCAQFALSRNKILERPKEDYERLRRWIMETELEDSVSGRIVEYSWHMWFGKPDVNCPEAGTCYCNVFGLCDLVCDKGKCKGQYELPPYSSMPPGWKPLPEYEPEETIE